jgi:hypothetical protein
MPAIAVSTVDMKLWGDAWLADTVLHAGQTTSKYPNAFNKRQGSNFAGFIDREVASKLAMFLGGIPIVAGHPTNLQPSQPDCVEMGPVRIIGGIRPQNFDVAYRPDGPRVVFDSKTLNDKKSVSKNWQNMVNDIATEAATVHTRYPYAVVGFMVVLPEPSIGRKQKADIVRTLERLGTRNDVLDQVHLAESLSLIVWDPSSGEIDSASPPPGSPLRIERFSERLYPHYQDRYKGLPPHD